MFIKTAHETGGRFLEMLVTLPADGEGPPMHRHKRQTEYFEVVRGRLCVHSGNRKIILEAGQSFAVPKNTPHKCYSADGAEAMFKVVYEPALNIEYFLSQMFASANRKKSKKPSSFDASYILGQVKDEFYLATIPDIIQNSIFRVVAAIGRITGRVKAPSKSKI